MIRRVYLAVCVLLSTHLVTSISNVAEGIRIRTKRQKDKKTKRQKDKKTKRTKYKKTKRQKVRNTKRQSRLATKVIGQSVGNHFKKTLGTRSLASMAGWHLHPFC